MSSFHFPGFRSPHYTQVPDEAFDVLLPILSPPEFKVLMYIIRRTFGFKRDADQISLSQLVRGIRTRDGRQLDGGTGLGKSTVCRVLAHLEELGIILTVTHRLPSGDFGPTTYALHMASQDPVPERDYPPLPLSQGGTTLSQGGTAPGLMPGQPPVPGRDRQQIEGQTGQTVPGQTGPDPAHVWAQVLGELEAQVTRPLFETYLRGTEALSLWNNVLIVLCPSEHSLQFLSTKLRHRIATLLSHYMDPNLSYEITFELGL